MFLTFFPDLWSFCCFVSVAQCFPECHIVVTVQCESFTYAASFTLFSSSPSPPPLPLPPTFPPPLLPRSLHPLGNYSSIALHPALFFSSSLYNKAGLELSMMILFSSQVLGLQVGTITPGSHFSKYLLILSAIGQYLDCFQIL